MSLQVLTTAAARPAGAGLSRQRACWRVALLLSAILFSASVEAQEGGQPPGQTPPAATGQPAFAAPPDAPLPLAPVPPQVQETPLAPDPSLSPPAALPSSAAPAPDTDLGSPAFPQPELDPALRPLPRDLSPWGMFAAADWVVKAVMIGLAFASLVTWTIALVKGLEVGAARLGARAALDALNRSVSLTEAATRLAGKGGAGGTLVQAALNEAGLSADLFDRQRIGGIKERIAAKLARIEATAGRRLARATGLLASIGATAPFVGLFGTVWGIMNAFIGISETQTTNLAVVAPGIAEALLATAFGLVAAIPAVVIYNLLARAIAGYRAALADASTEVLRLASRDLDRGLTARPVREAAE